MHYRFAINFLLFLSSILFIRSSVSGQQAFTEGVIIYSLTMEVPGQEGLTQYRGTYTIKVKSPWVKRELEMSNGYNNTMIFNSRDNTGFSIQGEKKYALKLDMAEMEKKNKKYEQFSIREYVEKQTVAGMEALRGQVQYKSGESADIFFIKEWYPVGSHMFDQFPNIEVLPVVFDIVNSDGIIMHFRMKKLEARPVDNAEFRIPKEFKIISPEELKR